MKGLYQREGEEGGMKEALMKTEKVMRRERHKR